MAIKILLFNLLSVLLLQVGTAQAAEVLEQNGLAITPFLFQEEIQPGKSLERSITIANTSQDTLPLEISINDFEPVGKSGQVRFLNPDEVADKGVSLASWIKITKQPKFTVEAGSSTELTFTINPPLDADIGTHYGGILFSYRTPPESGSNTVIVKKVAALIMVQLGTAKPAANITKFTTDKRFYTNPSLKITTEIQNTGNTYLAPKGKVEIRNVFGRIAGITYINENAQTVLPGQSREFISSYSNKWLLGYYTAHATIWYGNPRLEAQIETTFWVFPLKTTLIYGGGVLLLLILLYFGIRRYNKWLISRTKT